MGPRYRWTDELVTRFNTICTSCSSEREHHPPDTTTTHEENLLPPSTYLRDLQLRCRVVLDVLRRQIDTLQYRGGTGTTLVEDPLHPLVGAETGEGEHDADRILKRCVNGVIVLLRTNGAGSMLCQGIRCGAGQCGAVPGKSVRCRAMWCGAGEFGAVSGNAVRCRGIRCSVGQCGAVPENSARCREIRERVETGGPEENGVGVGE